jgi:hypothetical protein
MARLPNGMIFFLGNDDIKPGCRLLDIEITNSFPLISVTNTTYLIGPNRASRTLTGYDHLSIPPDYKLHLSSSNQHLFFNVTPVWEMLQRFTPEPFHFFTIIGLPARLMASNALQGPRKWHGCAIISPFLDSEFNATTRFSLDFFLHRFPINPASIDTTPFVIDGMRHARDRSGSVVGPFTFGGLQRKTQPTHNIMLSMRMGYIDLVDSESFYLYTALEIFSEY